MELNAEAQTVAQLLAEDHRKLDHVLDEVLAIVSDKETERAESHAQDLIALLTRHIRIEEEILFPVFEKSTQLRAPCAVMRHEHDQIRRLLGELDVALKSEKPALAERLLIGLSQVLTAHNEKEEHVLYPRADEVLSADARETIRQLLL